MALQSIIMPIISLFKSAGITQARSALFGLNKDFTHFAQSVGKAAGAFAAFQGLAGAREFLVQSVEQTQRFERNMLALAQVFEGATPQLRAFTREVENYGLSQSQAAQASVFLGSVLKQYGFSVTESADQTERLVRLAQDLATTYGYDVQEALLAITALFRGEYDPIEKFGVAMKQNEINAELAARGLGKLTGQAEMQAAAQVRLELLFERANDSIGAYTRATDTLYVAQQNLAAIIANLQVAFGAPLQEPIAELINLFAEMAQKYGPDLEDVAEALGVAIDSLAPLVGKLAETFFLLLGPLDQAIRLVTLFGQIAQVAINPTLVAVNGTLGLFESLLNAAAARSTQLAAALDDANGSGNAFLDWVSEATVINWENENTLENWIRRLNEFAYENNVVAKAQRDNNNEQRRFELQAQRSAEATEKLRAAAAEVAPALTFFQTQLELLSMYGKDVEGNLTGLAGLFVEIGDAAAKSKAREELTALGIEAGAIEEILTRPDWNQIFGEIAKAAAIAAMPISEAIATMGAGAYFSAVAVIEEINKAFRANVPKGGTAATDYVKEFFNKMDDEVAKQTARRKLAGMGASQGLIDAILGAQGWEKVFDSIVKGGIRQLQSLQRQFNRTADGIDEINKLQEEAIKLAQEQEKAAKEAEEALRRQQEEYDNLIASLEAFKASLSDIAIGSVLETYEAEVGRFEQAVIRSFEQIQTSLRSALDSGSIFQNAYNQLVAFARQEQIALQNIARQRDELAAKGDWVENLLRQYRNAFTGAANLTNIIGQLESTAREQTVTEVSQGIARVGSAMREVQMTITRSYTETIQETIDKSQALVQNFRDIAERARAFAQNLDTLRRLGLDPQLFNQLVQAGVEAGGETAQALVDGGAEAINEINSLFREIGDLGVQVGETVAEDFYAVGEGFASQLLDGIRSQQMAFEETARQMSQAFQDNFNVKLGKATQQVADVAAINQQVQDLTSKTDFWATRIEEERAKLATNTLGPNAREWANKKIESYTQQIAEAAGQVSNLTGQINAIKVAPLATGGVALGAALAMIGEGGPEAVIPLDKLEGMINREPAPGNTYVINVTADTRAGGVAAGEAILTALKSYGQANGPVNNLLGASQVVL